MDGKELRRSYDGFLGKDAIWMLDAWASENQITLGQLKVNEKSNAITAIPELLELLLLHGCIVTIDAMGCQTSIAEKIIEAGADYVLAVKENQGNLYRDIEYLFEAAEKTSFQHVPHDHIRTVNKHGRIEIRQCWCISNSDYIEYLQNHQAWKGLKTIAMVDTEYRRGDQITQQRRYYISSLQENAEQILHAERTHWQVENSLNWVLDVAFREDDSRIRKEAGPQNMAVLRRLALNMLKRETSVKRGVQGKRFLAGWDNGFLFKVLFNS